MFGLDSYAAAINTMEIDMHALELALSHISHGTSYSWDLSILISFGVPVSHQLRQKVLSGSTTINDANWIRDMLNAHKVERRLTPRN